MFAGGGRSSNGCGLHTNCARERTWVKHCNTKLFMVFGGRGFQYAGAHLEGVGVAARILMLMHGACLHDCFHSCVNCSGTCVFWRAWVLSHDNETYWVRASLGSSIVLRQCAEYPYPLSRKPCPEFACFPVPLFRNTI